MLIFLRSRFLEDHARFLQDRARFLQDRARFLRVSFQTVQDSFKAVQDSWKILARSCKFLARYLQDQQDSSRTCPARFLQDSCKAMHDLQDSWKIVQARPSQDHTIFLPVRRFLQDSCKTVQDCSKIVQDSWNVLVERHVAAVYVMIVNCWTSHGRRTFMTTFRSVCADFPQVKILGRPCKILARPCKILARSCKFLASFFPDHPRFF